MKNAIIRFLRDEEGTELVEWGLIAGLVVVVAAGFFLAIGTNLSTIFGLLDTQVQAAADGAGAGAGGGGG